MDKFGLNWRSFEENIRECFSTLRQEQRLFDVTLATDDGQNIKAHKIILSAGSHFFSDIFMRNDQTNMLVYLKGITSAKLEPVLDFLYSGETSVPKEELNIFIEIGKELKVKGLDGEITPIEEPVDEKPKISNDFQVEESQNEFEFYYELQQSMLLEKNNVDESVLKKSGKKKAKKKGATKMSDIKTDEDSIGGRTKSKLGEQISHIIEKHEDGWKCKVCDKTAPSNSEIRKHAEGHIEGITLDCKRCGKTFSNRTNLSQHISNIHSALFTCYICGKSGMKRGAYLVHKSQKHRKLLGKH